MSDKELRLKELKEEVKPFNILGVIESIIAVAAAVLIVLGLCIKDNATIDKLFWIGIGAFGVAAITVISFTILKSKQFDEINKLKKEIKKSK